MRVWQRCYALAKRQSPVRFKPPPRGNSRCSPFKVCLPWRLSPDTTLHRRRKSREAHTHHTLMSPSPPGIRFYSRVRIYEFLFTMYSRAWSVAGKWGGLLCCCEKVQSRLAVCIPKYCVSPPVNSCLHFSSFFPFPSFLSTLFHPFLLHPNYR